MRFLLAFRNLLHDRINFLLVAGGVAVAIVLVHVQIGLFLGFREMTAGVIDHAGADLWVVPKGTDSFDDPSSTMDVDPVALSSTPGVRGVRPLVVGFAQWRSATGRSLSTIVVGTNAASDASLPWSRDREPHLALDRPDGVMVDETYRNDLDVAAVGDLASLENERARVGGFTDGIRSFTSAPYVFTRLDRARDILGLDASRSTYLLVDLDAGARPEDVAARLRTRLGSADVLATADFRSLNADHWLFSTGAGAALMGGAVLGVLVGAAIVAQTLHANVKDNLPQFATLRALGARRRYVVQVVVAQALVSGLVGYAAALAVGVLTASATAATAMPVAMSWHVAGLLLTVTVVLCGAAAIAAVGRVLRVDPMMVFSR